MIQTLKHSTLLLLLGLMCLTSYAQNMSINQTGAEPDSSAMLDVRSTTQGFLMPRMTQAQRNAIVSPADALLIFQTDNGRGVYQYDSAATSWNLLNDTTVNVLGVPVGTILSFGGDTSNVPAGYLICDGSGLDTTSFNALFQMIGYAWGGSGSTFMLPDLRGQFLRGTNLGGGADPDAALRVDNGGSVVGDVVGSYQGDTVEAHSHTVGAGGSSLAGIGAIAVSGTSGSTSGSFGGSETRPTNAAVNFVICYNSEIAASGGASGALTQTLSYSAPTLTISGGNSVNIGDTGSVIRDTDGNTQVQTEESANDDIIRFDIAGNETYRMDGRRLHVSNTGASVYIGENAGNNDNAGSLTNVAIGDRAMESVSTTTGSVAIGYYAARNGTGGFGNVAIGREALYSNGTGSGNTNVGYQSGLFNTSSSNTLLGYRTDWLNSAGANNVLIGYEAGYGGSSHTKSGNIRIGYRAGYQDTADNRLYIENSSDTANPLIWGDFSTNTLSFSGPVGIGTRSMIGAARLVINQNTTGYTGMYVNSGTGGEPFYGYSTNGTATAWTYTDGGDANKWKLYMSGVRMTVTQTGDVGIGTTTPSEMLEVNGNVAIPAANEYTYTSTQTRYKVIGHPSFRIATTDAGVEILTSVASGTAYLARTTGGTSTNATYMVAPLELPDGAVLTNLEVRLWDQSATDSVYLSIVRQTALSPARTEIASAFSTATYSSGQITVSTSTFSAATIDNQNYHYFLQLNTREASSSLGIYNCRITYTVTKTD